MAPQELERPAARIGGDEDLPADGELRGRGDRHALHS
jgi:hypothetical protein